MEMLKFGFGTQFNKVHDNESVEAEDRFSQFTSVFTPQ